MKRPQHTAPTSTDSEGRHRGPLEDRRLEEIRKRVEEGYYDGDAVVREVAEAFIECGGNRRAVGGPHKAKPRRLEEPPMP